MKKYIVSFAIAVMAVISCQSVFGADSSEITVKLNDEKVEFAGQNPLIVEGRTLIPLRGVFEKMGYTVSWEGSTKTAVLKTNEVTVSVSAGSSEFSVNGNSKALDVPAQIMNGSMMLPLRAIGEAAGASVTWNGAAKTVEISTNKNDINSIIAASDYLVAYAKATEPLSQVANLCDEMALLEGEITATELQSYRVKIYNAIQAIDTVTDNIEHLNVPDGMTELQKVRLESIKMLKDTLNVMLDYCDGKISQEKAEEKIKEYSIEGDEIIRRSNSILENLKTK